MADYELLSRETWDTARYYGWKSGTPLKIWDAQVVQHHTAGDFIEPEPEGWYEDEEDPRPAHLGLIRKFRAIDPGWSDTVAARRRWNGSDDFEDEREQYGKITKWSEIEHRRTGAEVDSKGRPQWVSVRIDTERIEQLKLKRKARNRIRAAKLTRIKALERSAMRAMDAYHKRAYGWRGIGYNLVQFSRRFYAGRAVVQDGRLLDAYRGAHTGQAGWNRYLGISWNGDFTRRRLPHIMRVATIAFLRDIRCSVLGAHYDVGATACPGIPHAEIASLAKEVGATRP